MSNQQVTATGYPPPPNAAAAAANGYPLGGAGHPYGAPPPQTNYYYSNTNPNPNMYYYQTPHFSSQRATFFRRFMVGVICAIGTLAAILFVIRMMYRPRVPEFRINSLSVSLLNATSSPSSQIFGNWTAQFTVVNPNSKMHAYYEEFDGYVYYKSEVLAQNRLAPFDQDTKAERNVSATLVATAAYVHDWVVSGVNADRSNGSVKFNVRLASVAHFKARGWKTSRMLLRVFCDDLTVGVSKGGSGMLTTGNQNCFVTL